jgi:hypothetical protein
MAALVCWLGALGCLLGAVDGWAYRPFFSTDAAVADPQEEEIELGYFTLEHAQGQQTFTLPSLVLNDGLWRDLEVVGEFVVARDPAGELHILARVPCLHHGSGNGASSGPWSMPATIPSPPCDIKPI